MSDGQVEIPTGSVSGSGTDIDACFRARRSSVTPVRRRFLSSGGMAVLTSKALHEQLCIIMGALTKAAVAEICEVVDEGYAVLQMEITRSHKENEDLKKKLHLIESIVVRGSGGGTAAALEFTPAAEGAQQAETQQQQQQQQQHRDGDGGATAAAPGGDGGGAVVAREELPDVVLIKDEDSDSNDAFEDGNTTPADGGTAAAREATTSTPISRSTKRHWPAGEEANRRSSSEPITLKTTGAQKKSVTVYTLDSPRSEPGCSTQHGGDEMEAGDSVCSYSTQMDADVQLVHQESSLVPPSANRQTYFGNSALMESPTNRAELDLSLTWTKQSKSQMSYTQFHQNENLDSDAFGLKMISVTGSTSTDCQLSESSNSAFEYDDADMMNYNLYRDQSGRPQLSHGQLSARGKRFACAICSKTYATSQNLDVHMRIHTGERPFSCSQCGKKFTQSAHLKSHLSVHSGERPYACTLCSRSFIVKYSLKLHMKKCHPNV